MYVDCQYANCVRDLELQEHGWHYPLIAICFFRFCLRYLALRRLSIAIMTGTLRTLRGNERQIGKRQVSRQQRVNRKKHSVKRSIEVYRLVSFSTDVAIVISRCVGVYDIIYRESKCPAANLRDMYL